MKTRMIKSAGVILIATLMTIGADAQYRGQGGRGMGPGNEEGQFARLELTDAQSETLSTLRTEHYKSMKPLRAKMTEIKARERSLLAEEKVDLKAVDKVIDQQTELMNKIQKEQIRHRVAMKDVLSDEQLMKLEQRKRRSANMRQGRNARGDRDGFRDGRDDGRGDCRGYGRGYGRFDRG